MDELIAFLRARYDAWERQLAEDERVALAANAGGGWHYSGGDSVGAWTLYDEAWQIASLKTYRHESYDYAERMPAVRHPGYVDADANGEHIARWGPQRVLDEVEQGRRDLEAKRRILDDVVARRGHGEDDDWEPADAETDGMATNVIRLLAQPYAGDPGFRAEWAA